MPSARSVVVSAVAWTVGAASSVGIGLVALTMIGTGFSDRPLEPVATPTAVDTASPGPWAAADPTTPTGSDHTVATRGGTLIVRCVQSGVFLVGWSPAPGYRTDDLQRGPAPTVSMTFESTDREVSVNVACEANTAQPTIHDEARTGLDN
jgi:hypothetical protein